MKNGRRRNKKAETKKKICLLLLNDLERNKEKRSNQLCDLFAIN